MLVCPASWFAVALSPGASLRRLPSAVKRYGHARHKVDRCLVSGEHSISSPVHGGKFTLYSGPGPKLIAN
jgi:hypothetical protein